MEGRRGLLASPSPLALWREPGPAGTGRAPRAAGLARAAPFLPPHSRSTGVRAAWCRLLLGQDCGGDVRILESCSVSAAGQKSRDLQGLRGVACRVVWQERVFPPVEKPVSIRADPELQPRPRCFTRWLLCVRGGALHSPRLPSPVRQTAGVISEEKNAPCVTEPTVSFS